MAPWGSLFRIKLAAAPGGRLPWFQYSVIRYYIWVRPIKGTQTGWGPARTVGRTGRILFGYLPGKAVPVLGARWVTAFIY